MPKLTLDLDALTVETFATRPEIEETAFIQELISRRSCIEQCTTSCVP